MHAVKEVRRGAKRDIMCRLQQKAQVDVFGNDQDTFSICWKGQHKQYDQWKHAAVLFICAPIGQIKKTISVVRFYKLKAIIIIPAWREIQSAEWYYQAWALTKKYYYYKEGHPLWIGEQPPWGSFALMIDGCLANRKDVEEDDNQEIMAIEADHQPSGAWERRKRRKKAKAAKKQARRRQGTRCP